MSKMYMSKFNTCDYDIKALWSGIDLGSERLRVKISQLRSWQVRLCQYCRQTMLTFSRWWCHHWPITT